VKQLQKILLNKYIFLFLIIIYLAQPVSSQEIQELKITGNFVNIPVKEFFGTLEENYGIRFFYKEEWLTSVEVTGIFNEIPLAQALEVAFKENGLNFEFFQDHDVLVFPKSSYKPVAMNPDEPNFLVVGDPLNEGRYKRAVLSGRIFEGKTGEPLPGAVLYNPETKTGTTSDKEGSYRIEIPTGNVNLKISFIGFENKFAEINLIEDGTTDFDLFEKTHDISEVTVLSQYSNTSKAQMSMIKMTSAALKEFPVLMGEPDLLKSIGMMPGVQSVGEMSSGFNVRGGNTDQNLILLDGAPVFNSTHLFGFLSMINPDAVNDVTLYMGGIPASFGERISSVMEVGLKDGSGKPFSINGGIGLISSRLSLEGPLAKKSKSTFMIGGRTTYSDWFLQQTRNPAIMNSVAHFYDLNGTANIEIGTNNHLKLMTYISSDVFNLNSSSLYNYGNTLGSLNWKLSLSEKLVSHLSLAWSNYISQVDQKDPYHPENDFILNSDIKYGSLKYTMSIYPNRKHQIHTGFQSIGYWINPGKVVPSRLVSNVQSSTLSQEQSAEFALFADDDFDLSEKLTFNFGLRYTGFINYGPGTVYDYAPDLPKSGGTIIDSTSYSSGEAIKTFHGPEPRISIKYNLDNGTSLRLSYQRIRQYVSQISNTAVITPADYWKSSGPGLAPLINDQVAVGIFKNSAAGTFETSVEAYYKKLQNLWEYKNGAQLLMNNHIETDLLSADGYSYGMEFLVKKNSGQLNGWLSYTYSRTFRKTDGDVAEEKINGGDYYPSVYDKPHDLSMVLNYKIGRRWRFSGNFVFSSGRPITLPEQKYVYGGNEVVIYSDRNKYRMPSYHRMDIAVTFDENLKIRRSWKGSWTFSIYNLYGRKNPYSVFYRKSSSVQDENRSEYSIYKLSIIGVPVPSITYNFRF